MSDMSEYLVSFTEDVLSEHLFFCLFLFFIIYLLVQKNKQRSTKHTHKTKDRETRTPLKTGGELGCSGRVSSSCCTSDTRRVNLVTNPVISHE
jgi:uncharacterized membrane protein YfcA